MTQKLTTERLKELLNYDQDTGIFTLLISRSNVLRGAEAGTVNGKGYRIISIDGRFYYAHRLAWFYVHGTWPKDELDHINGHKADNRLANLREATHAENQRNKSRQSNNTSGFKGVCWRKKKEKWRAQIQISGETIHIGYFATSEEASAAYEAVAAKSFGKFYRLVPRAVLK